MEHNPLWNEKNELQTPVNGQCGNSCELEFASIKNTFFNAESLGSAGRVTFYDESVRFSDNMFEKSFLIENQSINNSIKDFFKREDVYKPKPSEDILTTYGWEISKLESIKVSFVYLDRYQLNKPQYFISSFSAKVSLQPEKDNEQLLPTAIIKSDGEYQYNQFQDKIDYLMIQRRDFDKFNYSYLYWVSIFNFFDDNFKYMSEMSIKLNGFKQNSKFTLIRSFEPKNSLYFFDSLEFSSFGNVFRIEISLGMVTFYENDKQLIKFIWKNGWTEDFINVFLDKLIIMIILFIFYAMMIN